MKLKKQGPGKRPQTKMRRGYKKCQCCGFEMHIHKRVCEKCNYENTFIAKLKPIQSKNSVLDFFKKMSHTQNTTVVDTKKIKKVPKRYMSSIHVFKKSFLYKNDTNFDQHLLNKTIYIKQEQPELNFTQLDAQIELPKKIIIVDSIPVESGEFYQLVEDKGKLIYFGCAILALAIKQGLIIVSLQMNQYQNQQYNQLHQYGKGYKGQGTLCIIAGAKRKYITHDEGAILTVKFHSSSTHTVGSINGNGSFTIFSLNCYNGSCKINCKIVIKNQLFSCFDWSTTSQQVVAIGDQSGNVYIISIKESQYEIVNFLDSYHNGIVKDLQFYLHSDTDNPLLLSGSYDGNIKIINPLNNSEIFNKHISSKGVTQVKWDIGGKFIIAINDDPNQRALMFTFFSIIKKDQVQALQYAEKRMIQPLTGDEYTQCCASNYFHNKVYFASQNGTVYGAEIEQIRKQAIKKEKKQTYNSELIHYGQIVLENNVINYHSKKDQSKQDQQEYDWSRGYHYIDVDENGQVVMANILGILIIK